MVSLQDLPTFCNQKLGYTLDTSLCKFDHQVYTAGAIICTNCDGYFFILNQRNEIRNLYVDLKSKDEFTYWKSKLIQIYGAEPEITLYDNVEQVYSWIDRKSKIRCLLIDDPSAETQFKLKLYYYKYV